MRTLPRLILVLLSMPSVLVACIPQRNNPFDPVDAPIPRLQFEDGGTGVDCTGGSALPVASIVRSHCLVLDASTSTPPHGSAEALTFQFAQIDSSGHAILLPAATVSSARLIVQASQVLALPVGKPVTYQVTVTGDGHGAAISAAMLVVALAPQALADPPRYYPAGGYSWNPGAPFAITLDASRSYDPDGDPIEEYCWTLPPGATGTSGCSASPTLTTTLPSAAAGTFPFVLTVKDAYGNSHSVQDLVTVGSQPIWIQGFTTSNLSAVSDVSEVDPAWRALSLNSSGSAAGFLLAEPDGNPGDNRVVGFDNDFLVLNLYRADDFTLLSSLNTNYPSADGEPEAIFRDPTGRIWILTTGSTARNLQAYQVVSDVLQTDGPLLSVPSTEPEDQLHGASATAALMGTDAGGNLYYSGTGGSTVRAVTPAGSLVASWPASTGNGIFGLGQRPSTGEVWEVEGKTIFSTTAPGASITRLLPGGALTRYPVAGELSASGMAWISADRFWAAFGGQALLIDATTLVSSGQVSAATLLTVPISPTSDGLNADPATGTAWLPDGINSAVTQLSTAGLITTAPGQSFVPQQLDQTGTLWSFQSQGLASLAHQNVVASSGLFPDAVELTFRVDGPSGVDGSGGLWSSLGEAQLLRHYASDGTLLQQVESLQSPQGLLTVPLILAISADPAGTVWGSALVENSSGNPAFFVYHMDPAGNGGPQLVSRTPIVFGAETMTALKVAGPARAWTQEGGFFGGIVWAIIDDQGEHQLFNVPGPEQAVQPVFAASDMTGNACGFTFDDSNFRLRYLTPTGTITTPVTIPLSSTSSSVLAVDAAPIGAEDVCWVAWRDASTTPPTVNLQAYDTASGKLLRQASDQNSDIVALFVSDDRHAWALRKTATTGQSQMGVYVFPAGAGLSTGTFQTLTVVPDVTFAAR